MEAAREIGCGEATPRRRLSSARARLQARLRDDDLRESPGLPVVPPRLFESAVRVASGPPRALASAVLREIIGSHLVRIAGSILMMGMVAAGVAWALGYRPTPAPAGPQGPPVPVPAAAARIAEVPPEAEDDPMGWGHFEVTGRVVAPDGKPVAGAVVFRREYGIRAPKSKAATNALGRFRFQATRKLGPRLDSNAPKPEPKVTRLPLGVTITVTDTGRNRLEAPHTDDEEVRSIKPWLVATAPGYGFGTLSPGDDVTIHLVADEPIEGRLVNRSGRPVAGARVRVRNVSWPQREGDPLLTLGNRRRGDSGP